MRTSFLFLLAFTFTLLLSGCEENSFPRPRGYPRIDLPAHTYKTYDNPDCPFTLQYPAIGQVKREQADSCMFNIVYPDFNCSWHLTYRHIPSSGKSRAEHEDDYRKLVMKHVTMMSHLNELILEAEGGTGVLYEMYGKIGAPAQMIFGDSTHLLMTSFYFEEAVDQDSLKPLIDFMKQDLQYLAGTLEWR